MTVADHILAPVPPPARPKGPIAWASRNLFNSVLSSVTTLVLVSLIVWAAIGFGKWAIVDAIWSLPGAATSDTAACRTAEAGACWALIHEKARFILFGLYPYDQQWRPGIVIAFMILLFLMSADRRLWGWPIAITWGIGLTAVYYLMAGGVLGLAIVGEDLWGGLPVTLILSVAGIALAFPLAILIALGRTSTTNPTIRTMAFLFIEIIRGIPIVTVLFMASVLFPLFLSDGITISKLLRAQIAIIIFVAAYLAEIIRGGLAAVDKGQSEAAASLGLGYWQSTLLIRMPQALRMVLPPMIGLFIGCFKNTSLVMTIGIFDLLNAARRSVADPAWQGFGTEAYLFVGLIYFGFCFAMSRYGQSLEIRRSNTAN